MSTTTAIRMRRLPHIRPSPFAGIDPGRLPRALELTDDIGVVEPLEDLNLIPHLLGQLGRHLLQLDRLQGVLDPCLAVPHFRNHPHCNTHIMVPKRCRE